MRLGKSGLSTTQTYVDADGKKKRAIMSYALGVNSRKALVQGEGCAYALAPLLCGTRTDAELDAAHGELGITGQRLSRGASRPSAANCRGEADSIRVGI